MTSISRNTTRLFLLIVILALGWTLRTHDLEARSLWEDEGWTMLLSQGPGLGTVTRTLAADQHPPLFFVLFRLWRSAAGDTEFAGRYFGVLAGAIAIAAVYQVGRALFSSPTGVLAALLLALSDLHIDLSQEVRHYGLFATWIVVSSLFYVRWWRRPSRANRIGFVLSALALLYTHYLGGFVLLAQGLHMLLVVRPRRRLAEGLLLGGAIFLGFLPWLPVVIDQNRLRWENPLYYQNALPNTVQTYRVVRTAVLGGNYVLLGGLALLGLVYVAYSRANHNTPAIRIRLRPVGPALYLAIWIGLMTGLTAAINARREFLTVRNFIVIVPAVLILAGHGLANLERAARLFLVSVLVVIGLTTVDARRYYPDWRAVTRNVSTYHLDSEPVLMDIWVGDFPVRYYIERQMGQNTPAVSLREWRDHYKVQFLPTLLNYLDSTGAFWLICWGDAPLEEYGGLIAEAGFQQTAALSVDHLGTPIYSYRYDKLTRTTVAVFGDLFVLRRYDVPARTSAKEPVTITLWWTAEQVSPLDYSVSVFALNAGGALAAQHDGPPLQGAAPTSGWQPGDLKFDQHALRLPPGDYQIGLKVYWYGDNLPLPVDAGDGTLHEYASLGVLHVDP